MSQQQTDRHVPGPIWAIALVGLAVFPVSAGFYAYGSDEVSGHGLSVLLTWSTVMLSFLGGVRWGMEVTQAAPRWTRLAASALSPLAGWGLLVARGDLDTAWLICGFMVAFILQWLFDHSAPDVPSRYPRLMTVLTLGACLSLAVALEQALRM